jgi:small subunit ribosomal protein S1
VGDELQVKLLTVDATDRRITASRKLLIENPQHLIESTFRPNTDHNGTIKEVTRGGLVVALEHGAEGFIPRRELSHDKIDRLEDVFKAGKPLEGLRVIEFDRRGNRDGGPRITLSLIAAEREAQRTTLREYRAAPKESRYSLSDSLAALKAQLEAKGQ